MGLNDGIAIEDSFFFVTGNTSLYGKFIIDRLIDQALEKTFAQFNHGQTLQLFHDGGDTLREVP